MSKDYAALLAQVIPVIALALGLELRSALARFTADQAADSRPRRRTAASGLRVREPRSKEPARDQYYMITAMWICILVLAFLEIKALSVVAGHSLEEEWEFILAGAILVAFLSPVANAILRTSFLRHETRDSWRNPRFLARALLPVVFIVAMLYMLIAPIFWQ